MIELFTPYAIPLVCVTLSAWLLVMTLERIFGLLGRIPLSGWFVRHRKRWRFKETKRIENVTAGIILRMISPHGEVIDVLGDNKVTQSYNDMVTRIHTKYPIRK